MTVKYVSTSPNNYPWTIFYFITTVTHIVSFFWIQYYYINLHKHIIEWCKTSAIYYMHRNLVCMDVKLIRYPFWCIRCTFRLLSLFSGTRTEKVGSPKRKWKCVRAEKIKYYAMILRQILWRIELCMKSFKSLPHPNVWTFAYCGVNDLFLSSIPLQNIGR
jgi:hypothetical protein